MDRVVGQLYVKATAPLSDGTGTMEQLTKLHSSEGGMLGSKLLSSTCTHELLTEGTSSQVYTSTPTEAEALQLLVGPWYLYTVAFIRPELGSIWHEAIALLVQLQSAGMDWRELNLRAQKLVLHRVKDSCNEALPDAETVMVTGSRAA